MNAERLKLAKEIGATTTVVVSPNEEPSVTAEKVVQAMGRQPDYTIDCVGFESTVSLGLLVSNFIPFNPEKLIWLEITLIDFRTRRQNPAGLSCSLAWVRPK